jgi:hypothetical protein
MATEFDPMRKTTPQDPITRVNDPMVDRPRSSMAPYGIAVAVAVALALGLMFWGMSDRDTAGVNTAPGVTTGSSTTVSPSNPPPAPGIQQGQGQSNSTR